MGGPVKRRHSPSPPPMDEDGSTPSQSDAAPSVRRNMDIASSSAAGAGAGSGTPTTNGCGNHCQPEDDSWESFARKWRHCTCASVNRNALVRETARKFVDQVRVSESNNTTTLVPLSPDQRALVLFIVGMLLGENPGQVLFAHGCM
jgi:hypothetical protein